MHAARRHAKKKVREDFLSPLGDMSARADIFGSITLFQVGGISMRTKERSLGQAFSKACGVSGQRPDLRPQNAGGVNLHAAKRRAKRKVREDFLSPLGDMSAKADIFGSIPHVMSAKIRQGRPRPPCGQKPGNQERKKQKACPRHLLSTATAF